MFCLHSYPLTAYCVPYSWECQYLLRYNIYTYCNIWPNEINKMLLLLIVWEALPHCNSSFSFNSSLSFVCSVKKSLPGRFNSLVHWLSVIWWSYWAKVLGLILLLSMILTSNVLSVISGPQSSLSSLLYGGLCGKCDKMSAHSLTFYVFSLTVVTTDVCGPMLNLFVL